MRPTPFSIGYTCENTRTCDDLVQDDVSLRTYFLQRQRAGRCTVNPLSRGFALCSFSYLQSMVVRKHDVEGSRNQQCALLSSAMKSCAVQLQPAQTRTVASSSTDTPQTPAHLSRHSRFHQQTHCHGVAGLGFRSPLFYLSTTLLREGRGAGTSDTPGRSRDTRPFSGKVSVALWTFRGSRREKPRSWN